MEDKIAYFQFVGPMDLANSRDIMTHLYAACKSGANSIHLGMSSPGGQTGIGIQLYNFLTSLPVPIITHNTGFVDSAAVSMFLGGTARLCSPVSAFMLHAPSQNYPRTAEFSASFLSFSASQLQAEETFIRQLLTKRTAMEQSKVLASMSPGLKFLPDEAKACGLVSGIELFAPAPDKIVVLGC